MKKTYIVPALDVQRVQTEMMIAASITNVQGPIGLGDPNDGIPEEADVKGSFYGETIFD